MRDKVVTDEILSQEAERRGLAASSDFKAQMEIARQSILIGLLSQDVEKKAAVTDAEVQTEYDKFKAQASGTEYKARHILVEKEDERRRSSPSSRPVPSSRTSPRPAPRIPARRRTAVISTSRRPSSYVPEFSQAMVALKKGDYTEVPVKTQFGYHIIKLEDTRAAQFPPLADVKAQIQQRLTQQKAAAIRDELRAKAKTDYKFTN